MKTVTLRTLVRETRKVKRLTRVGSAVLVTDHGRPLWIIRPVATRDEKQRYLKVDALLDEVLRGPRTSLSLSKIILDSRR